MVLLRSLLPVVLLALAVFGVLTVTGNTALAQSETGQAAADSSDPWPDAVMPLVVEDGHLGGDGAIWLRNRAQNAQFIMFGEQHGVEGLPQLVAAAYDDFYADGFHYMVLENGPWLMDMLSEGPINPTLEKWPYSLSFKYDAELELLRTVEGRFDGQGQRFWGLDQENNAIHPLQRIVEIAPDHETARLARGILLKAVVKAGRYLRRDYSADLIALREAIGPDADPEILAVIEDLLISQEIYVTWLAGHQDPVQRQASVLQREQYMVARLDEELAVHEQYGKPVKAIFKMGGAHVIEGIGPNGIETLGTHAERVARQNGLEAIQIGIRAYPSEEQDWLPLEEFEGNDIVVIDSRQLLAYLPDSAYDSLPASLHRDLEGYDALIYLRDAPAASRSTMRGREAAFRETLLTGLAVVLLPLVLLATGLVMVARFAFRSLSKGGIQPASSPWQPGLVLFVTVGAALTLAAVQIMAYQQPASIEPATLTGGLFSAPWLPAVMAGAGLCVLLAVAALLRGWWGPVSRIHFLILALSCAGLAAFMYHWNIGGMLGS